VVLSLALGVGLNTVIFSAADAVLLRPLPFKDPDRLVVISGATYTHDHDIVEWFRQAPALESVASYWVGIANLSGGEEPERIRVAEVSASFLPLLGVAPRLGRPFTSEDERAGAPRVALVASGLWWRAFGADISILGRSITLEGQPHTVVGVLPPGLDFPDGAEVWVARRPGPRLGVSAASWAGGEKGRLGGMGLLARLKTGAARQQALSQVVTLQRQQEEEARRHQPNLAGGTPVSLRGLREAMVGQSRPSLLLLLGGAAFVLLIACANAAHLLLERSEARRREIAIRAAMGAGRGRLVRQLLVESLLLCLMVAVGSLVLAGWGISALRPSLDAFVPAGVTLRLDGRVFSFALAASLVTGLLAGLAPAWHGSRTDVQEGLRHEPKRGVLVGRHRGRGTLVVCEVAAAVALLVGAGLMLKSLTLLQAHTKGSLGFRPEGVVTFEVSLPPAVYSPSSAALFRDRLLDRLRALPGVESAAATTLLPYGPQGYQWFDVEGAPPGDPKASGDLAGIYSVTPEYLAAMGIPLRAGRLLTDADADSPVALVSEDLARRFWPGKDPLVHRIKLTGAEDANPRAVVGVVGRVRTATLDDAFPSPQVYVLAGAIGIAATTFVVHTRNDPSSVAGSIRAIVASIDKTIPPSGIGTMDARVARSFAPRRARSLLLGLFAGLATVLAALGIYAVMAYAVTLRTHEIGVRQALGAGPRDILNLVLGQGVRLTLLGLCLGALLSAGLSRLLVGFLFQVRALDPSVYAAVAASLGLVALAACWVPVRRAVRVDPATALRYE
jgi:putative ABC transport system permease protein